MDNKNEEKKEHFIYISPSMFEAKNLIIMGVIVIIFLLFLMVIFRKEVYAYLFKSSGLNIKYLTSSTSPGFDLTFTPYM